MMMDEKNKMMFIEKYLTNEYYLRLFANNNNHQPSTDLLSSCNSGESGGGDEFIEMRHKVINKLSPIGIIIVQFSIFDFFCD